MFVCDQASNQKKHTHTDMMLVDDDQFSNTDMKQENKNKKHGKMTVWIKMMMYKKTNEYSLNTYITTIE